MCQLTASWTADVSRWRLSKNPNIFHLDTPVIWTVLYVIIHGSLFKLEFKATNFRILVCRIDKKRMNSIWPAARLWNCGSTAPFSLPANCEAQSAWTRLGFLRATRCHTLCRCRFPPACQRLTSPVGLTGRCLRPTCCCRRRHRASFVRLRQDYVTRVRSFVQKELSVPAHFDFTSPSGTLPHPDWLFTRIETDLR